MHQDPHCWSFPNNAMGLGGIWPQLVVSKRPALSREAVILKEPSCLQTLVLQGLEVLLAELHCMLIGANSLISLPKMG